MDISKGYQKGISEINEEQRITCGRNCGMFIVFERIL